MITIKILEGGYQQHILYLEENYLLHNSHHGFRNDHSMTTETPEIYFNWVEAFEGEKVTAG